MFTNAERAALGSLVALYFVRMVGVFITLPVLALYTVSFTDYSTVTIGMALGALGLTQAILLIPMGVLSDRWGRKTIIYIGLGLVIIGSIISAFADSVSQIIVGRVVQGMGAITGVLLAFTSELIASEKRAIAMAIIGASIGISFGVALVLGPFIASNYGLSAVFWFCALLGVVCLFIVAKGLPQQKVTTAYIQYDQSILKQIYQHVFSNAAIVPLNVSVFLLHFMQMALWVVVPLTLVDLGYQRSEHWWLMLLVIGSSFILAMPLIRLSDTKMKGKIKFIIAVTSLVIGLLLAQSQIPTTFIAGLFFFFFGFCFLEAILPAEVSRLCLDNMRGATMGTFSTYQFLGVFMGGVVGGIMVSQWGIDSIYWLACGIALIWLLFFIFYKETA